MPQSSLLRPPLSPPPTPPVNKNVNKVSRWLLQGAPPYKWTMLPLNTVPPLATATNLSVAGGGVASVTTGTWSNSPSGYTYQWYRGLTSIAGATTNSHTLVAADQGYSLYCIVTATNSRGAQSAVSNMVGPVGALAAAADEAAAEPEPEPEPEPEEEEAPRPHSSPRPGRRGRSSEPAE
jgi:hypothetical protein